VAVRWPDGSYTGSVRVSAKASAPIPVEPEPEEIKAALKIESPDDKQKEASHGSR
jgi:hypothetical protein